MKTLTQAKTDYLITFRKAKRIDTLNAMYVKAMRDSPADEIPIVQARAARERELETGMML